MDGPDLVGVGLNPDGVQNLECWMKNLPEPTHSLPLNYLAIPGSHDSMSSYIKRYSAFSPDQPQLYNSWFIRATSFLSRCIVFNWFKTQAFDCKQQLECGIRYFDLRVACDATKSLYIIHGLYGALVKTVFNSMKDFLDAHDKEIILIDFQHFYDMNEVDNNRLICLLMQTFGAMLCPYVGDLSQFTLSWLWERGFQVIVFYRNPLAENHPFMWPSECISNPWPNTTSLKSLISFLSCGYEKKKKTGNFNVSQCVLTPQLSFIVRHFLRNLKDTLAVKTHREILKWLKDKRAGPGGLNIMILDFVDLSNANFARSVIDLNYKFKPSLIYDKIL